MKNVKPKTLILTAALMLSTTCTAACTAAENPTLTNDETQTSAENTATAETPTETEEKSETVETRKETELMTTAAQKETLPENETAIPEVTQANTQEIGSDITAAISAEAPGNVPDSYREDGESGIKIIGRNGHYMGLMGCWGTTENCDGYVEAVNRAKANLPEVNVYSMVIPTSSDFYTPDDVTGFTASQKNKIDHIAEGLSGVADAYAYSALASHTDEPIYTRTDHHWQPLGAYYAAEVFADVSGTKELFPPLTEYKKVEKDGYVGSLYNYSKSENLYSDPETFTMYISPNDEALKTVYYDTSFQNGYESDLFVSRDAGAYYCSFLGSDDRIAEISTDCKNGRCLVIFKESYGNALVPFLTSCFEKIYVCDVRYFELDAYEFCRNVGATDLLFATCTFTPAGPNCSYIKALF